MWRCQLEAKKLSHANKHERLFDNFLVRTQNPTSQQHPEVSGDLDEAAKGIGEAEEERHPAPAVFVRQGPREGADNQAGAESSDEQQADLALGEPVGRVQLVHVRPLQPIAEVGQEERREENPLQLSELGRPLRIHVRCSDGFPRFLVDLPEQIKRDRAQAREGDEHREQHLCTSQRKEKKANTYKKVNLLSIQISI